MRDLGLVGFWAGYFAARAAPLGRVGGSTVGAAFFNFAPEMVAAAVPGCWEVAEPQELIVVRAQAAAVALTEICSPESLQAAVGVLPLLREVVASVDVAGRVMAGANHALWPAIDTALRVQGVDPQLRAVVELWQAATTLREQRGDGHVAALVVHGLGGCEAHVLAAATSGVPVEILRDNRGWSDEAWDAAARSLRERGVIFPDATATPEGFALHEAIETMTDELAEHSFAPLSDHDANAMYSALHACARDVQASETLPFPNPMGLPRI